MPVNRLQKQVDRSLQSPLFGPRAWAEGFARLDPDRPPGDVPPKRWQRFVDDVGRFLDSPFCAVAAAIGWGPYDLQL